MLNGHNEVNSRRSKYMSLAYFFFCLFCLLSSMLFTHRGTWFFGLSLALLSYACFHQWIIWGEKAERDWDIERRKGLTDCAMCGRVVGQEKNVFYGISDLTDSNEFDCLICDNPKCLSEYLSRCLNKDNQGLDVDKFFHRN